MTDIVATSIATNITKEPTMENIKPMGALLSAFLLSPSPNPTPPSSSSPSVILPSTSSSPSVESSSTSPSSSSTTPAAVTSDSSSTPSSSSTTPSDSSSLSSSSIPSTPATSTILKQKAIRVMEAFPYTCPLCLDEFHERRPLYRIVGCRHLYCQNCIVAYYSMSIQEHKRVVKCPTPACENEILFCNVKNLLDTTMLLKFQRLSLKHTQNQKNGFIWCPGENCKTKIIKPKTKDLDGVTCTNCKLVVCFKCGEWEHKGYPCDGAEEMTEKKRESESLQKEAFETWKKECGIIIKNCPKCGAVIERESGCSHMTCKPCGHQFCFICLSPCKATHCR